MHQCEILCETRKIRYRNVRFVGESLWWWVSIFYSSFWDDQRPGHPNTSKTDANIEKVSDIVRQNRCLSIQAVAEIINIDKETVRQILHNNFNVKKVCPKMVLRLLTPKQKEIRMSICADILQDTENDPNFLENVITCD